MRNVDTLFYSPKVKPLQPIIENIIENKATVSIIPGFAICPNLKQKFVPIEKKEIFNCEIGDSFYLVIDGNLESLPISINSVSIKKKPKIKEEDLPLLERDPTHILLADVLSSVLQKEEDKDDGEEGDDGAPSIFIKYYFNFDLYGELYFIVETFKTTDENDDELIIPFTRFL